MVPRTQRSRGMSRLAVTYWMGILGVHFKLLDLWCVPCALGARMATGLLSAGMSLWIYLCRAEGTED